MPSITLIALLLFSVANSGGITHIQTNNKVRPSHQAETLGGPQPPLCAPGNVCPPQ